MILAQKVGDDMKDINELLKKYNYITIEFKDATDYNNIEELPLYIKIDNQQGPTV